ncbi:HlyD family efflux transporter periplasmic adaptor subunit [Rhizobium sp. SL86]|uniref:HlyD family efflux transporter periplasmic adaptor subunit n=1 Tax=Rhizobium sp. SL86 TaxID=2995148 RepID=UPI0022747D0F|nr:HlyD family efflux transporter periplasmic adaptor subunit [Rhizobium sp. SL86]MCY1668164.1 efflux RND transporter periplasmic adaptor subunit [Rhizobium sp. SL86]
MSETQQDAQAVATPVSLPVPRETLVVPAARPADPPPLQVIRRLWRLPVLMVILFTGAVIGLYFQPPGLKAFFGVTGLKPGGGTSSPIAVSPPPQLPVAASDVASVTALGHLLPRGKTITVSSPYGGSDARIAKILVDEGDHVTANQVLAELDNLPSLRAAVTSARANLAASEATLSQTKLTVSTSLAEAKASEESAKAALELAEKELARARSLQQGGASSTSTLQSAEAQLAQANSDLLKARSSVARYDAANPAEQADIALATRNVEVAKIQLDTAERDLSKGTILSPIDGTVISLISRVGERPSTNGLATLGDTENMQVELEVYQTDIRSIAPGQSIEITSPALASPLKATVSRVGLEVERQTVLSSDPVANTDARIVRVTGDLDRASSDRARGLTGLEVTGRITITGSAS